MPTFASHPLARISQKTLKALAKRLLKEHGVQPASIDAMTLDEVIWWLTD
ncbi:isopentenyldiphosphate isomerase [Paraburkholderia terricola]|jgi:isopentenyldiphosphate isomerase|uniref:Isopentenyldiphosphate isomerase n=1 Tax=Paraburkholderia terricola TaxID=169427 RepID=A0ABU1LP19_9BURK|nr:isopentenyldiphosphate isomerase [Paraburkholderia terricola]MDR6493539.1 isopentenyldiphosphate isomerase [Paraburkholderia terricola]